MSKEQQPSKVLYARIHASLYDSMEIECQRRDINMREFVTEAISDLLLKPKSKGDQS